MIKLMLVDDHALIREGLRQLLELDGDFKVCAECSDGGECLKYIREGNDLPDVMLLDINMPKVDGLKVIEQLKADNIDIKIIVLTVHNEIDYLLKAIELGVDGYIVKDSDLEDLKKAISCVYYDNESYIQPELIPVMNSKMISRNTDQVLIDSLTKREREVLELVATGLFNKEIASKLGISDRTVKNHIFSIFHKIKVADRTQAAVFAIRNGLVDIY